jgi:hypothetical protein
MASPRCDPKMPDHSMKTEVNCPHCGQHLLVDSGAIGKRACCPKCQGIFGVPGAVQPPVAQPAAGQILFCPSCGEKNDANSFRCAKCGCPMHKSPQPQYVASDSGLSTLIPYKNTHALLAYYFGVFALIPCFGIPLGVAALILGIMGVKHANLHPEAKGKVHAWVGIILGGLCSAVYLLFAIVMAIGIFCSHR